MRAPAAPGQLGAIRIVGNRAIASDALAPALALHEAIGDGAAVDPYLLTLDTDRIRAAYIKRGFFAVTVTPSIETARSGVQTVVFTVSEGRRAAARVEIAGLPAELVPGAARSLVALADGAPFDYERYDAAKAPLAALVENAGYARALVRGTVVADPASAVATVRYEVVPGPRCRFGRIEIRGVAHDDLRGAVRARLRFAEGDRYARAALADSEAEIDALGRFSTVRVVADRSGTGADIPVTVELTEASRHEVHLGFGVGVEPITYEARVFGGGSLVPAAAPLITLATDARAAYTVERSDGKVEPKLRLLGSVQRLDLAWPGLRGEIEGGLDYQTVEAYTWTGGHVRIGLASPLGPRWLQARVGWLLQALAFGKFADELMGPAARDALGLGDGTHWVGAYQAAVVADLRDDPIEPHRGVYLAISGALGGSWAGGQATYQQVAPELRGYVPLAGSVLAARARLGEILGDVPPTERYYAGGTTSQRGFSERYLAPRATAAAPGCSDIGESTTVIGGAGLIETSIELRRQLVVVGGVPLGTTVFLDGADVRCRPGALSLGALQWAAGAGVWSKIAGLKVHVDVGYRLNRRELSGGPSAFGNFAWHIGVAETF